MLIFIAQAPDTVSGRIVEVHSCLKIKCEIELRATGNIYRDWPHRCDESGGGGDIRLEGVFAPEIQFQAQRIDAAAVNSFAAVGAVAVET